MALNHSPKIVTSGLVLALDAANPKSYPGSGTVWTDLSGKGNNGTLVNGVGYSGDNLGSLVFDGVNDYVNCGNIGNTSTSSYEIWFRITSIPGDSRVLFSDNITKAGLGFYQSNSFILSSGGSGDTQRLCDLNNLNSSGWNYVVVVYNNKTPSCFINTIEASYFGTNYWTNTTNNFEIGRRSSGSNFAGFIGIVKIYNRVLSSLEIQQNFNALRGRYGI
jgi:hypothetical protein